jgi:hypothetical protein
LFGNLINEVDQIDAKTAGEILTPLLQEFRSCKRIEVNEDTEDARLGHLIYLISSVFKKSPEMKEQFNDKEFFDFVVNDCLFRRRKDKKEINYPI